MRRPLNLLGLIVLCVAIAGCHGDNPPSNAASTRSALQSAEVKPTIPPPKFKVYRSKRDEITIIVVAPSTSDEQLKSLLWLFREKVRSHQFKDLGIMQPTATQRGESGYLSGMIVVYKGQKCANETYGDARALPCGFGDHSVATYQWGLLVNGVFDTNADFGEFDQSDGHTVHVFESKDRS